MGYEQQQPSLDDRFGPVTHRFKILRVPEGGVPEEIRRQWVDTVLPVRPDLQESPTEYRDDLTGEQRHNPHAVAILVEDAVVALIDQGKQAAADFWGSFFAPNDILVFREHEGNLDPIQPQ
jgi:hypothetical protein